MSEYPPGNHRLQCAHHAGAASISASLCVSVAQAGVASVATTDLRQPGSRPYSMVRLSTSRTSSRLSLSCVRDKLMAMTGGAT